MDGLGLLNEATEVEPRGRSDCFECSRSCDNDRLRVSSGEGLPVFAVVVGIDDWAVLGL